MKLRRTLVEWNPSYRIISTQHPPIDLFERLIAAEDWETTALIEGLTNDNIRDEIGDISLILPEDRRSGAGWGLINGAFTHPGKESRFTDGSFGIYYCAKDEQTALLETAYHRERFLAATSEPAQRLQMKLILSKLSAKLHNLRGKQKQYPAVYDPDSYALSKLVGLEYRSKLSMGLVYDSVRHRGGECAAVMRPPALSKAKESKKYTYFWDGTKIAVCYENGPLIELK